MNPENFGFCPDGKCLGNGVLNISKCSGGSLIENSIKTNQLSNFALQKKGISAFISKPHFLHAEEKFRKSVAGLKPELDKHDFILNIEPVYIIMK